MAVLFFNSSKTWGGGEKWHFEISSDLAARGWKTVMVTNRESELFSRLKNSGQKVYNIKITNLSFLNPLKIFRLKKLFLAEETDRLIINLSADLKVAGLAGKLAGVKRIIYRRGSAIPIKNSLLNRFLFRYIVTDVIANSEETKKTINANNPSLFPNEKIRVIYNGLDFSVYDHAKITRSFDRNPGEFVIGNLGRFVKQKAQHYMVELAVLLKQRKIPFKIIIGGDGPLKDELALLASARKVQDVVLFPGFITDIKGFMTSIDVFVLTSLWEGFGYVIAEAMYFEKPVVAFNVSSNPELIINKKNGFLTRLGDIETMAENIEFFYHNHDLLADMGKFGKDFVTSRLSIQKTVSEVIHFLENQ
ncbi:MAG: glycosyltransferase family 4 protein [Bacteroidales bacterium]|nr:glycosyltransferase family 4 protein [Bacteroidales bacterium]